MSNVYSNLNVLKNVGVQDFLGTFFSTLILNLGKFLYANIYQEFEN